MMAEDLHQRQRRRKEDLERLADVITGERRRHLTKPVLEAAEHSARLEAAIRMLAQSDLPEAYVLRRLKELRATRTVIVRSGPIPTSNPIADPIAD